MPLTDQQVIETRDDLEMLSRPHLWPGVMKGLRCVFVKRRGHGTGSWNETGPCILWGTDPDEYIVVASGGYGSAGPRTYTYDSPEAITADGWVVD